MNATNCSSSRARRSSNSGSVIGGQSRTGRLYANARDGPSKMAMWQLDHEASIAVAQQTQESAHVSLAFIAGGAPKLHGRTLLAGDDGSQPDRSELPQALLAGTDQLGGETLPSPRRMDGKPVEAAAPSVPTHNQRSNELCLRLGEEERPGVSPQ